MHSHRISLSGDIELSPGPKRDINQSSSVCQWNLNSVASHKFSKIQSLKTYNSIHKFDIICLSESYINTGILLSDNNLQIPGHNFVSINHPSYIQNTEVCAYTTNVHCLRKLLKHNIFKNILNLRLKLATKHATSSVFIDLLAKQEMNLRISLRIQNSTLNTL